MNLLLFYICRPSRVDPPFNESLLDLIYSYLAPMKNSCRQRRLNACLLKYIHKVLHVPRSAARHDRDVHGAPHEIHEVEIESASCAVPIDAIQQDLPCTEYLHAARKLDDGQVSRFSSTRDGALVPPSLARFFPRAQHDLVLPRPIERLCVLDVHPPRVDRHDDGLTSVRTRDRLDGAAPVSARAPACLQACYGVH